VTSVFRGALFSLLLLVAPTINAERLPIKTYTTADGLPRDYVTRIVQDSKGFLWFCTIEGLSRFDGYEFKNYGIDQGLPSRYINDFLETRDGVYWVASNEGLCRFDPDPLKPAGDKVNEQRKRFVPHLTKAGSSAVGALVLFQDRQGTVWCGADHGLYQLEMVNGQWTLSLTEVVPNTEDVVSIAEDRQGYLWLLTSYAVYRYRAGSVVERYAAEEGLSNTLKFQTMITDRECHIWVSTWHG